ncbi:ROK family protein [Pseudalkalibacillus sp. R45]|uniref:ROK family protein n=1 Tax=Pseudalkalibacillus sp. R45 TaxID=3457433 RepID=UPI003FCE76BD
MQIGVIDIGGTSIKFGAVDDLGTLLYSASILTEAYKGGREVTKKVLKFCDEIMEEVEVEAISISSAGQIDSTKGVVVFATDCTNRQMK